MNKAAVSVIIAASMVVCFVAAGAALVGFGGGVALCQLDRRDRRALQATVESMRQAMEEHDTSEWVDNRPKRKSRKPGGTKSTRAAP